MKVYINLGKVTGPTTEKFSNKIHKVIAKSFKTNLEAAPSK